MNDVAWCYLEGFGCKKDKASFSLLILSYPHSRLLHPNTKHPAPQTRRGLRRGQPSYLTSRPARRWAAPRLDQDG
jgi:hypothetical protein